MLIVFIDFVLLLTVYDGLDWFYFTCIYFFKVSICSLWAKERDWISLTQVTHILILCYWFKKRKEKKKASVSP